MVTTEEIMDMLDWHMPSEIQAKGRALAMNMDTFIPFIQPLTPNEALKQFMNMPIDEFASHFFIRHTIMPATYSTTTNWCMMQISSE